MRSIHLLPVPSDVDLFDTYRLQADLLQLKFQLPLNAKLEISDKITTPLNHLKRLTPTSFLVFGTEAAFILDTVSLSITPATQNFQHIVDMSINYRGQAVALVSGKEGNFLQTDVQKIPSPNAIAIDAVFEDFVLVRASPNANKVTFTLVNTATGEAKNQLVSSAQPVHVRQIGNSVFVCGSSPVWSADCDEPKIGEDEQGFVARIDFSSGELNFINHSAEFPVISTTGDSLALEYFVESAAVLALPSLQHTETLPGISYIRKSRLHAKFVAVSSQFTLVAEDYGAVRVFKNPHPGAQTSGSASLQFHGNGERILGVHLDDTCLILLTDSSILVSSP